MLSPREIEENGTMKPEILRALRSVLAAKAFVEILKPISVQIYKDAISKYKPRVSDAFRKSKTFCKKIGTPITDPEKLYKADEDKISKISKFHKAKLADKGFTAENKNHCPVLVAESLLSNAEFLLINIMETYTGIPNRLLILDKRTHYLELVLKMLVTLATHRKIPLSILKADQNGRATY